MSTLKVEAEMWNDGDFHKVSGKWDLRKQKFLELNYPYAFEWDDVEATLKPIALQMQRAYEDAIKEDQWHARLKGEA